MAQNANSPGVNFNEIDQSILPPSPSEIGAGFVGIFERGPAFQPITVENWSEFVNKFGDENVNYYTPYAVKGYLRYRSPATIIRVLGLSTYSITAGGSAARQTVITGSDGRLFAEIYHPSTVTFSTDPYTTKTATNFHLDYTSSTGTTKTFLSLSMDPNSPNFIKKRLNSEVSSSNDYYVKGAYGYGSNYGAITHSTQITLTAEGKYNTYGNLTKYNNARTTWIRSQNFNNMNYPLFRIHNLNDGNSSNTELKISIANISPSPNSESTPYGTFDVLIRSFGDTDTQPNIIETHRNCSFDENSENYILRVIGDEYRVWNDTDRHFDEYGNYERKSRFIRAEIHDLIKDAPPEALPFGFDAYEVPNYVGTSSASAEALPSRSTVTSVRQYYGINFDSNDISDALQPALSSSIGTAVFPAASGSYATYSLNDVLASASLETASLSKWRKFSVPMFGGWDAIDNSKGIIYSNPDTSIETGLERAFQIAGEEEEVNVRDIFVPGFTDSGVLDSLLTEVEERSDVFAVIDTATKEDTIATQNDNADNYDTSFAATYYPWVQLQDVKNNRTVWVPPSVAVAEVLAYNDNIRAPWWIPAGQNRGQLPRVKRTAKKLYKSDRDELYSHNVNPIANLGDAGIFIYGQKTLQKKASALDRVNVRRLLIDAKKFVKFYADRLVFEFADESTWTEFKNNVNPYLEEIKMDRGLTNFMIIMDETNNTPEDRDRHIVNGAIVLQPTPSAEYLNIGFVVTSQDVQFSG